MDILFPDPARSHALGILPPHQGRDDRCQHNACNHCRIYFILLVYLFDKVPYLDLLLPDRPRSPALGLVPPDAGCDDLGERPPLHCRRRDNHLLIPLHRAGEVTLHCFFYPGIAVHQTVNSVARQSRFQVKCRGAMIYP